jgi:hypothetical protein
VTDGQSVSKSWYRAHLGLMTRYLFLFDSYGLVFCGAPSVTRGWVCLLYMLLALASAVFLWSEYLGTRDNILLSQVWDFSFVASYDSQGHGGSIRPRLHTGMNLINLRYVSRFTKYPLFISWCLNVSKMDETSLFYQIVYNFSDMNVYIQ